MSKKEKSINLVVIGHVDSGKSTTSGNLILKYSNIDPRVMEKHDKESKDMGKHTFRYAWLMDNRHNERERGITIEINTQQLTTENRVINLIDAPGHRDFIKNMITGTSQADCALLIISAAKGEFESGISQSGQTKEHLLLAQTLGIKHIVFGVNKMDATIPPWDQTRFNEIVEYIKDYTKRLGFRPANMHYVPISGFHTDNLYAPSPNLSWYKGKTLIQILDGLPTPKRPVGKPPRMTVSAKYRVAGVGLVLCGKVEQGTFVPGDMLKIMPKGIITEAKSIEAHHQKLDMAGPGDNIGINVKNVDKASIVNGTVVGNAKKDPPSAVSELQAHIINLKSGELRKGYSPTMHVHTLHVNVKFTELLSSKDRRTGKEIEKNPQSIKKDQAADVVLTPIKPIVVDTMKSCPSIGRFSLRDSKKTVSVGVVTSVKKIE